MGKNKRGQIVVIWDKKKRYKKCNKKVRTHKYNPLIIQQKLIDNKLTILYRVI